MSPPGQPPGQPLGRSGLDLLDLLSTTDVVANRPATGAVALEVGLEQARGALVRNLPGDSLAALDGVWEAARRSEEGWYLRSGALTVMGLPGESERVAGDGLQLRPESKALHFLQSLARLSLGDVAGARTALQAAQVLAPREPLLRAQQALLLARQGDRAGADALLHALASEHPDHPAVDWGRAAVRAQSADATRLRSRPTPVDWPTSVAESDPFTPPTPSSGPDRSIVDVTAAALERFGKRVAQRPLSEVAREARLLIRAFSAGGTLASAVNPEQAHAARVVLTTFLGVASGEPTETPVPVRTVIEQLVPLMQSSRASDAEAIVRRHSALAREPIGRLLLAVVGGAIASAERGRDVSPSVGVPVVQGETERLPLVPVRLGLGLLEETTASRAARLGEWAPGAPTPGEEVSSFAGRVRTTGSSILAIPDAESRGEGWGAARAVAPDAGSWQEGAGMRAIALVCVVVAMLALVTGHGAVAIGLGAGAAWLGLRRSGGDGSHAASRVPDTRE